MKPVTSVTFGVLDSELKPNVFAIRVHVTSRTSNARLFDIISSNASEEQNSANDNSTHMTFHGIIIFFPFFRSQLGSLPHVYAVSSRCLPSLDTFLPVTDRCVPAGIAVCTYHARAQVAHKCTLISQLGLLGSHSILSSFRLTVSAPLRHQTVSGPGRLLTVALCVVSAARGLTVGVTSVTLRPPCSRVQVLLPSRPSSAPRCPAA